MRPHAYQALHYGKLTALLNVQFCKLVDKRIESDLACCQSCSNKRLAVMRREKLIHSKDRRIRVQQPQTRMIEVDRHIVMFQLLP